jgi:centrin-1
MAREANHLAKIKLAAAKGYSSHDMMTEQEYNSYQDQEIIENGNG